MKGTRFLKPLLFLVFLMPMSALIYRIFFGDLGANPIETLTHETGAWTLRLLLLSLTLTPLRLLTGQGSWIRLRRMTGLFAYFYACLHFSIWFVADHSLDVSRMLEDVLERPYISVGFSAFLLLTPLALTSNQFSMRRLGTNWKRLHQLVYPALGLVLLHYFWLVKADYLEPVIYTLVAMILLAVRIRDRAHRLFASLT